MIVEPQVNNVTLIYNQVGDPNVADYRIYGGTVPQPQTVLLETEQTLAQLTDLQNFRRYYFRVIAVDIHGTESDFSNEEKVRVVFQDPNQSGKELVNNGNFDQGKDGWIWELQGGDAQWSVSDGVAHLAITQGGGQIYSVQLHQAGIPLLQGQTYVFSFDAWAAGGRVIEAKVARIKAPSPTIAASVILMSPPNHSISSAPLP